MVNDPIADMLTRIRNAIVAKHDSVVIPSSKIKKSIADILLNEGYINSFEVVEEDGKAELFLHVYVARHWQDGTVNVRPPLYYRISVQK